MFSFISCIPSGWKNIKRFGVIDDEVSFFGIVEVDFLLLWWIILLISYISLVHDKFMKLDVTIM